MAEYTLHPRTDIFAIMTKRTAVVWTTTLSVLISVSLFTACGAENNPFHVKAEKFLSADNAAAMVFAPDGRLFYGEQYTGNIRVVSADGQLQVAPFATVPAAA